MTAPAPSKQSAAATGAALTLGGTAVGAVANMALLVLVVVQYGGEIFGMYSVVTALFLLVQIVVRAGTDVSLTYVLSRNDKADRPYKVRGSVVVAGVPVLAAALVGTLIGVFGAAPIAGLLVEDALVDEATSFVRVLSVALPFAAAGDVLMATTRGLMSMKPTVIASNLGRQLGQLVLVLAVSLVGDSVVALAVAWAVPYLATIIYPLLWLSTKVEGDDGERDWRGFWRYSGPQSATAMVEGGLEKFDILALGALTTSVAAGAYALANRLIHVVILARYAINVAQAPFYGEAFARGDMATAQSLARRAAGWTTMLCGPVLWFFIAFADVLLETIDPDFAVGSTALRILAVGLSVAFLLGPNDSLLQMSGRPALVLRNVSIALVLNIGLNLWLIPAEGPTGAAIAWISSLLLLRGLSAMETRRRLGVVAFGPPVVAATLLAATAFGVGGGVFRQFGNGVGTAAVALAVGVVAYLAGLWWLRERLQVQALIDGFLRKS